MRKFESPCEPECPYSVHDPEVHLFGFSPHLLCYVFQVDSKHLRCRGRVNIFSLFKRLSKRRVSAHVGHHSELDLRIVGGENEVLLAPWDERLAY